METNAKTFDGKFENYTDDGEKFGIDWFDDYRAYFIGFYTVCSSSAVFGNILLLTVILKYTKLRTRVYLFIGNICVSDMFLGLVVMPYKAVSISVEEIGRRKYTCILRLVLISTFVGASILNLFCMSFERYFAVAHPLKHTKYYTNCRAVVLVMISWTVALVIGLLPLVGVNTWTDDATCFVPKVLPKSFMFLVAVIYFIFLMTSVVMYIIVARKALNHVKSKDVKNREIQYYRHVPFDLNRIKVMVIINGIFIVCWLPNIITISIILLGGFRNRTVIIAQHFGQTFSLLNAGINWTILCIKNKAIRKAFKHCFLCRTRKDNVGSVVHIESSF